MNIINKSLLISHHWQVSNNIHQLWSYQTFIAYDCIVVFFYWTKLCVVTASALSYLASQPVEHQTDVTGKQHLQGNNEVNDEVDDDGIISSIIIAMLASLNNVVLYNRLHSKEFYFWRALQVQKLQNFFMHQLGNETVYENKTFEV